MIIPVIYIVITGVGKKKGNIMALNKVAIKHKSRAGGRRAARAGLRRKINDKCIARHHETSHPDAAAAAATSCTLNGRY